MTIKRTHSTLAIIATLISVNAVSAGNNQPWHYDEDSDTVFYSFVGYPGTPEVPNVSQQQVENLPWHYHTETDTVVYDFAERTVEQATVFAGMTE